MFIKIDDALRNAKTNFERIHDAEWRRLGESFLIAMGNLEKQDLGDGWSIEPGNSETGAYRLSLLKNGHQAAVFEEAKDGLGNQILPDIYHHPLIDANVALDKLKLAIDVGLMWEKDPFTRPADEPEVALQP
ncbi:hypothetical protein KUV57_12365 [Epibacterium sp. DP7N7-1]|nr:hypothetical protein [Epibacterium sp. DP7N7-1]